VEVREAQSGDLADVRRLLREYASALPFALDFQAFDEELATLPGRYAPPDGRLLVGSLDGRVVGCVGVRRLDEQTCEMKRLFVNDDARGSGLGRVLAEASIAAARGLGYRRMRLDTLPGMQTAQALYARLGFAEIEPYTVNPVPGARFLQLEL
jgi:N-acetylglutamate synthase-like GNAT family acetyltransferase